MFDVLFGRKQERLLRDVAVMVAAVWVSSWFKFYDETRGKEEEE